MKVFACLLAMLPGVAAHASAPPPCITATLSGGGRILVLNELTYDESEKESGRHVATSTFRILERDSPVYEGYRLDGPGTYWNYSPWSVVFNKGDRLFEACSHVLATDDGEFLVIFGFGYLNGNALSIYRRRDHPFQLRGGTGPDQGVLVKAIPLNDLWPKERLPHPISDSTPAWFKDGVFAFLTRTGLFFTNRHGAARCTST